MNDHYVELPFQFWNSWSSALVRRKLIYPGGWYLDYIAPLSLSPSCVTRNTKGLLVVYCYSSEYSPIRDTIFHAGYDLGRFPFDEKSLNFWSRSRGNLWGNFLGMFTEDPTIIEFLQFEPMRSPGNSERQRKWHVTPGQGIFRKFGYTSRGCPLS